ncbi:MAG: Rieske 2Fe-2S domain-containing protein [Burkholderiales bacterium]|nr:Rieske 2Fe-2S domain-containing protein [Burkholderiales bacterium]
MGCGCLSEEGQAPGSVEPRRRILRLVVGLAAGMTSRVGFTDNSQIKVGDRLVLHTAEGEPVALRLADVEPGKVVTAYPFDPATKKIRNESRLNKVLLVRIDKSKLDEQTKQRAAGDVLAFSGVCTHAGCDVNAWMKQTSKLLCYCHGSQFDPYKSGKVAAGPAPRKLPWLPVKLEGEEFVVAGPFSAPAGAPA